MKLLIETTLRAGGEEALQSYLAVVGPLMEEVGARILVRYETGEMIAGQGVAQFVSIVEYPDAEAVDFVFENPAYRQISTVREQAFSHYCICHLKE